MTFVKKLCLLYSCTSLLVPPLPFSPLYYAFQKLLWWKKKEDSIITQADLAACLTLSVLHFNKSLLCYLVLASLISVPWGNQDPVLELARLYSPNVNGIFLVIYILPNISDSPDSSVMYQLIRTWKERHLLPEAPKILKVKNADSFWFRPSHGF